MNNTIIWYYFKIFRGKCYTSLGANYVNYFTYKAETMFP